MFTKKQKTPGLTPTFWYVLTYMKNAAQDRREHARTFPDHDFHGNPPIDRFSPVNGRICAPVNLCDNSSDKRIAYRMVSITTATPDSSIVATPPGSTSLLTA